MHRGVATPGKVGPSCGTYFRPHFASSNILSYLLAFRLCISVIFHYFCSNAQVRHEFLIFNSHTEGHLLVSRGEIVLAEASTIKK